MMLAGIHPARGLVRRRRSDRSTIDYTDQRLKQQAAAGSNRHMKKKEIEVAASAADSSPITRTMDSNSLSTRREMLGGRFRPSGWRPMSQKETVRIQGTGPADTVFVVP